MEPVFFFFFHGKQEKEGRKRSEEARDLAALLTVSGQTGNVNPFLPFCFTKSREVIFFCSFFVFLNCIVISAAFFSRQLYFECQHSSIIVSYELHAKQSGSLHHYLFLIPNKNKKRDTKRCVKKVLYSTKTKRDTHTHKKKKEGIRADHSAH